jgi:hypothetical protein
MTEFRRAQTGGGMKERGLTTHDSQGIVLEHLILSLGNQISHRCRRPMIARPTVGTLHTRLHPAAGEHRLCHLQGRAAVGQ